MSLAGRMQTKLIKEIGVGGWGGGEKSYMQVSSLCQEFM